jgi:bacterioferritin-associated ferredoxin
MIPSSDRNIGRPVLEFSMIVCVCRRVSDRDIQRHVRNGCDTFEELQMDSGVASCCGRCTDCAQDVFDAARQSQAQAARPAVRTFPIIPIQLAA